MKICIVTPDIIGPINNGGIGTHCHWLARVLAQQDDMEVTVLFTGPYDVKTDEACRHMYAGYNIKFCDIQHETVPMAGLFYVSSPRFFEPAHRVLTFLSRHAFDKVFFQDWQAHGFLAIQAKRMGIALETTVLSVTFHGSDQWQREGMLAVSSDPIQSTKLDYAERYCARFADEVISPSQHMLDWVRNAGWVLSDNAKVIPYLTPSEQGARPPQGPHKEHIDVGHLAFFGRLETRKGLDLFCNAIKKAQQILTASGQTPIERVTFLGKYGYLGRSSSEPYLAAFAQWARANNIHVHIFVDKSAAQALDMLKSSRAIAILPSRLDNFPFTVLECLVRGIPFLASRVGGIIEMVSDDALFDADVHALADALLHRLDKVLCARSLYDPVTTQALQLQDVRRLHETKHRRKATTPPKEPQPKVSVLVAHYNHGIFLAQLLKSLEATHYPALEVVVVDDGSTQASDVKAFASLARKYRPRGWIFVAQDNQGPSKARNHAATYATGEYFIFMDADNLARSDMIHKFVGGMQTSGVDIITTWFISFETQAGSSQLKPVWGFRPLGPCLELGLFENVFGDTNFCIKREVFLASGGFKTEAQPFEDWEFLARTTKAGHTLDVYPDNLFLYRVLKDSHLRSSINTSQFHSLVSVYQDPKQPLLNDMLWRLVYPLNEQLKLMCKIASKQNATIQEQDKKIAMLESKGGTRFFATEKKSVDGAHTWPC